MARGLAGAAVATLLAAASVALALALVVPAPASPKEDRGRPASVGCLYSPETATVTVRLRSGDLFEELGIPPGLRDELEGDLGPLLAAFGGVERRGDAITVLDDPSGSPVPCKGGDPTVFNTDTIRVRLGKAASFGDFTIDLTYGWLAPGATDEGDGSSEIEIDAKLQGNVNVRMTRGGDAAEAIAGGPSTLLNLNPGEPVADHDVTIDRASGFGIDGAGAGDALSITGSVASAHRPQPAFGSLFAGASLTGGQGDDLMTGGPGSEIFTAGGGRDRIRAGPGADLVFVFGRGRDLIDCGPGPDVVLAFRDSDLRLRGCEDRFNSVEAISFLLGALFGALLGEPVGSGLTAEQTNAAARAVRISEALPRSVLRRTVARLRR